MNAKEAEEAVAIALAACPAHAAKLDANAAKNMVTAWMMMLEDLPGAEVAAALKRHIATSKWLPSVAELRELVAEAKYGDRRPGGDAWGDVLRAIATVGAYRSPAFADPVVARCVHALGWRELCLSENQAADRARFVELYDKLAATERREQTIGALPGASRQSLPSGQAQEVARLTAMVAKRGD